MTGPKTEFTVECYNCKRRFEIPVREYAVNKRRAKCPHCGKTREYDTRAILKHNFRKQDQ